MPSLSRRRLLTLGAIVGLSTWLTGCTTQPPAAPIPLEPDELAVNRAVAAARALRTDALALVGARPQLTTLLRRMVAVHEAHLVALGSPISDASPSASASTAATPAAAPTATQLIKTEIAAAQSALRDGEAAAPAFAVLLCRIAAARIVNADLLSTAIARPLPGALEAARALPATASATAGSSSATEAAATEPDPPETSGLDPTEPTDPTDLIDPSTPAQIALNRLLAGEHAAVFAYPLIIARAATNRRNPASALWQAHRSSRDELSTRLLGAGIRPAVAEPAYDVGTPPANSTKAAALAARVERGLAALASDLLVAGEAGDDDRSFGADQLVLAARRTAGWTGRPAAFPGLTTRPTATTSAATP